MRLFRFVVDLHSISFVYSYYPTTELIHRWGLQSVSSVASRQHLRSANRALLVVPSHRLSSNGRRAFSVAGPAIWNWLPDSMRDPAISRDSFRRSLKTFLLLANLCTLHIRAFWTTRSKILLTYLLRCEKHHKGRQCNAQHGQWSQSSQSNCHSIVTAYRDGLTIRGVHTNVRRGPFLVLEARIFLSVAVHFFPKKLTTFF